MRRKRPSKGSAQRRELSNELMMLTGMSEWRDHHPTATLREIEEAMDERLAKLRAGMLEELVNRSPQADWSQASEESRPVCEQCGKPLQSRGKRSRWLQTSGGQQIEIERSYGTCPECGQGLFPLDEELGLTSSDLTPHAQEGLVRLATWVPYAKAVQLLESLVGVHVSQATAHRWTTQAGEAVCEAWEEQTTQLEQRMPEAPKPASQQVMSADGAMVPLRGGAWAEVKTLVIGEVKETEASEKQVQNLSYCSRLADVAGFEHATLLETHRRGTEQASEVAAVMDGAEWLQGFVEYHRADAVRMLDFAHAAEYVHAIGEAVQGAGHRLPARWLDGVLHRLKHDGPERVLLHLARLCQRYPTSEGRAKWQYLLQRHSQMQYPLYQSAGWPIGSGMGESANKLVVEARLKGAGMHWKRENVNPMLLLRNAVCNDRWSETWQGRLKQAQLQRQQKRHQHRQLRLQQAKERLTRLLLPLLLSIPQHQKPVVAPVCTPPATVSSPAPKGRTEAQYRWGRRPVSPRGARIQAGFAKL